MWNIFLNIFSWFWCRFDKYFVAYFPAIKATIRKLKVKPDNIILIKFKPAKRLQMCRCKNNSSTHLNALQLRTNIQMRIDCNCKCTQKLKEGNDAILVINKKLFKASGKENKTYHISARDLILNNSLRNVKFLQTMKP